MRRCRLVHLLILGGTVVPGLALAASVSGLVISRSPTRNVVCSAGVCTSAAESATLNVDDLTAMLATASVTVKTAKHGPNISVEAPLAWGGTNTLTLDAYRSVRGDRPVAVPAGAGLGLLTNDHVLGLGETADGILSFGPHGYVTFGSLSDALAINGVAYALVDSVAALAAAVAANPSGAFALASDYDARADGTYAASPVSTGLLGSFEGLGHKISRLTIRSLVRGAGLGLFESVRPGGSVRNLSLVKERIKGLSIGNIGGLAGQMGGSLQSISVDGQMSGKNNIDVGGIAGVAGSGKIDLCSSTASVQAAKHSAVGGLVGSVSALIGGVTRSFATGPVSGGDKAWVGGLAGYVYDTAPIVDSYATGPVSGGSYSNVGGLVGFVGPGGQAATSYSTGLVTSLVAGSVGGFSSHVQYCASCYWDTTTSETLNGVADGNQSSVLPLTTPQLQAGLPAGFDSTVWGENSSLNDGLPYLLANPPK